MKLLATIIVTACMTITAVKTKPIFSLQIVDVPVIVPKVNIFGAVSQVLGIKAALIGQTLKAKANVIHKVANIKAGLGGLLASSVPQEPAHVTVVKPVESAVVVNQPVLPPSTTYGAPPPPPPAPSSTYGAPYPA